MTAEQKRLSNFLLESLESEIEDIKKELIRFYNTEKKELELLERLIDRMIYRILVKNNLYFEA